MYGSLDISTSGMIAQRTRLTAISANLASKDAWVERPDGEFEPFRRRIPIFRPGDPNAPTNAGRQMGVHVADIQLDQAPFELNHDPDNPRAFKDGPNKGYVPKTNIDTVTEQIDAIEAIRAYEANVAAAEATKSMMAQALRVLA